MFSQTFDDFADFTELDETTLSDCNLISFDDFKPIKKVEEKPKEKVIDTKYMKDGHPVIYDHQTSEHYRALRAQKMDPFEFIPLDDSTGFKFSAQWDAYTGERQGVDPYGPLYFNPDGLVWFFYLQRLNGLWVNSTGEYEGYYDNHVGAGEDIEIIGRGKFPEQYLFRLPISDCYLTKDHSLKFTTLGPKLTQSEIEEIDKKARTFGNSFAKKYGVNRPSLVAMKKWYDQAISKIPAIENADKLTFEQKQIAWTKANRLAVEHLKAMH